MLAVFLVSQEKAEIQIFMWNMTFKQKIDNKTFYYFITVQTQKTYLWAKYAQRPSVC